MTTPDPSYVEAAPEWLDRLAQAQAKYPKPEPQVSQVPANKEGSNPNNDEYDTSVKTAIKSMNMLDFYRANFKPAAERQLAWPNINVSCFNHIAHPAGDQHPQFCIDQDQQVYICYGCGVKGDMVDLMANYYGLADGNLRCPDANTDAVITRAGEQFFGAESYISATGVRMMMLPDANPATRDEPFDRVEGFPTFNMGGGAAPFAAPSLDLPPDETSDMQLSGPVPTLDWRNVLDPNGFAYSYMNYAHSDDSVEEFHLYNAFIALGLVAGRELTLQDGRPVHGNVFICDMGATGAGKSSAARILTDVLDKAVPYRAGSATGVRQPPEVGSGEILVDMFTQKMTTPPDPTTGRKQPIVSYMDNISALLNFDELSSLMNRIARQGTTIEGVLQSIYDCKPSIGTASRTHGEIKANNAYGSMITTSQPDRIADLVKKEQVSSGFANRMIYVFGERKPESAFTPVLGPTNFLADRLKYIADWAQKLRNTVHYIKWEDDAYAYYREFFESVVGPTVRNDPDADLIGRMGLTLKKHIFWLCMDIQSPTVTIEIVDRAKLFYDYLYNCYKIVAGHMMQTEMGEREEEVIHALKRAFDKKAKWPTKNELRRDFLGIKKWTLHDLDLMMKDLVTHGHVEEMPPEPGKGNKRPRYKVATE